MQKQPSKRPEKPAEYGAFEKLARKLVAVPKTALDEKVAAYEANKKAAKKSPTK